ALKVLVTTALLSSRAALALEITPEVKEPNRVRLKSLSSQGFRILEGRSLPARIYAALALLSVLFSGPVDAQTLQVPRFDVGGELGGLGVFGEGLHFASTAGPRLTFNISQQDALDLAVDTLFINRSTATYAVYY